MQKQLASNTFSKGLNLDVSPITTPNDVLTGALNATFITYNGNEFILQNDIGNGRVETARLPEGYIPIGMKEYGGIVYVASYNPETNKGQIGSFPSPERNINSEESSETNKEISFIDFFDTSYKNIITTNFFIKVSNETILNPGDQFGISLQGTNFNYLSNYFNIVKDKAVSPKNNVLTIKVLIEDNNGNLKDITEKLKRIDDKGNILNSKQNSIIDNNQGYFTYTEKILDRELIEGKAINVFNEKNSGKLYLSVTLNIIQDIELDSFVTIQDNVLKINHTIDLIYNCPDGNNEGEICAIDEAYNSAYALPNNISKEPVKNVLGDTDITTMLTGEGTSSIIKLIPEKPKYKYNKETNLYTKQITYKGSFNLQNKDLNKNYTYMFSAVPAMNYDGTKFLLNNLKIQSNYNINKLLNANTAEVTTWKYYNNSDSVNLKCGIISYLSDNLHIENIKLNFFDAKEESKIPVYFYESSVTNFTTTLELNDNSQLKKGKIYLVSIVMSYNSLDGTRKEIKDYRWFITTPIYNNYYNNYNDFKELVNSSNKGVKEHLVKIKTDFISGDLSYKEQDLPGKVVKTQNELLLTVYKEQCINKITGSFSTNNSLIDSNLYPFTFTNNNLNNSYLKENESFIIKSRNISNPSMSLHEPEILFKKDTEFIIENTRIQIKNLYTKKFLQGNCEEIEKRFNLLEPYIGNPYKPNNHFDEIFGVEANGDDNSPYLRSLIKIGIKSKVSHNEISYLEIDQINRHKDLVNGRPNKKLLKRESPKGGYLQLDLNSSIINSVVNLMTIKAPVIFIGGCVSHEQKDHSNYQTPKPEDPRDIQANNLYHYNFTVQSTGYFLDGYYKTALTVGEQEINASDKNVYYFMLWYDGSEYVLNKKVFYDSENRFYGKCVEMPVNFYNQFKNYFIVRNDSAVKTIKKPIEVSYEEESVLEVDYNIKNTISNISEANFENINTQLVNTAKRIIGNNYELFKKDLGIKKVGEKEEAFFNIPTQSIANFNLPVQITCASMVNEYNKIKDIENIENILDLNGTIYELDSNNLLLDKEGVYELTTDNVLRKEPTLYVGTFNNYKTILASKNHLKNLNGEPFRMLDSYTKNDQKIVSIRVKFGNYKFLDNDNIILNGCKVTSADGSKYFESETLETIDLYY